MSIDLKARDDDLYSNVIETDYDDIDYDDCEINNIGVNIDDDQIVDDQPDIDIDCGVPDDRSDGEESNSDRLDVGNLDSIDQFTFEDFTFINTVDSSTENMCVITRDFTENRNLAKANPGSWMYTRILKSTPLMASSILTKYIDDIVSMNVVFLSPNTSDSSMFFSKKK